MKKYYSDKNCLNILRLAVYYNNVCSSLRLRIFSFLYS